MGINGSLQYSYSATQNNGQISQVVDSVSGETIVYQYDLLRRLTSASSTPNYGSSPTPWTQTFQYDGFGNLTAKVLNGTTTPIAVNAATNQLTSGYYDANGNMTSGLGATMTYDEANRTASAAETSGGTEYYGYAPDNKRIYRRLASGSEEWTLYGAYGEKLGVYSMVGPTTGSSSTYSFTPLRTSVWFTGMLIWEGAAAVYRDAVGTNRAGGARFYPYGDEITSTSNDRSKFGTYNRDSFTGFDYADQRYYASTYGRFNTADPYQASGGPSDPGSWNRYSYVEGDPINHLDRQGLCTEDLNGDWWDSDFGYELWLQYADQALYSDQGSCANDGTFLAAVAAAGGATLNGMFYTAAPPSPPDTPVPQVNCGQQLANAIDAFLTVKNSPLEGLGSWFVAVGLQDNVDPRVLVGIAGNESAFGTSHVAIVDNNAFGILHRVGNGRRASYVPVKFADLGAGVPAAGQVVESQIAKGNNTVALLYSGQPGAYCVDTLTVPCGPGANNVGGIMAQLGGNPNNLGFPCP